MIITNSQQFQTLKATLDKITTDNLSQKETFQEFYDVGKMSDAYIDDLEVGGTTLAQEKPEGQPMALSRIVIGGTKRYWARTIALAVGLSEESLDDNKYSSKCLQPAKRLTASVKKTREIDAYSVINNSTNTAATGGFDNLALASASHVIPAGGTYSNILTYLSPSVPAIVNARIAARKLPDPNGLAEGVELKYLLCPLEQEDIWKILLGTAQMPGGNWNDKNPISGSGIKVISSKWMSQSSTTQWGLVTDAENGLRWLDRKKPENRSWVDDSCTVMYHGILYRCAFGWSNPRTWLQGNT
jgi:hypothetical protein